MQIEAREYHPENMAPVTVEEAHLFAAAYNGRRPPPGHPMDFEKLSITHGLAPVKDPKQLFLFPDQQVLTTFNPKVPSFLLYWENVSLVNSVARRNRNIATGAIQWVIEHGHFQSLSHPPPDVLFMMFLHPDQKTWIQYPFMIVDVGKPDKDLKQEILELQQWKRRADQTLVMSMKLAVHYVLTGDPMNGVPVSSV